MMPFAWRRWFINLINKNKIKVSGVLKLDESTNTLSFESELNSLLENLPTTLKWKKLTTFNELQNQTPKQTSLANWGFQPSSVMEVMFICKFDDQKLIANSTLIIQETGFWATNAYITQINISDNEIGSSKGTLQLNLSYKSNMLSFMVGRLVEGVDIPSEVKIFQRYIKPIPELEG